MVRRFLVRSVARRPALDEAMAERAAELRAAHPPLRMPDALVLATADLTADVVVTRDQRWLKVARLRCTVHALAPDAPEGPTR
jgi:predicted nucleic acid-binding protein